MNVTEVGARNAESMVRIDFTDATDRVISTGEGRLTPRQPVTLELLLDMSVPRMLVRANVTIRPRARTTQRADGRGGRHRSGVVEHHGAGPLLASVVAHGRRDSDV